ncbi:UNVERIFIED_ORG: hypothetical protein BCL66_106222 [Martelella mediterranea]
MADDKMKAFHLGVDGWSKTPLKPTEARQKPEPQKPTNSSSDKKSDK